MLTTVASTWFAVLCAASLRCTYVWMSCRYAYEGLGPDFLSSKWIPPSVDLAKKAGRASLFMQGKLPIVSTGVNDLAALGVGITLYFRFLVRAPSVWQCCHRLLCTLCRL